MVKNDLFDRYCRLIISALERFQKKLYIRVDAELNRLQTDKKVFLAIDFSHIDIVKTLKILILEKMKLFKVFRFFRHFFYVRWEGHIYSFVERRKIYRLVYSLIFSRKNFQKKNSKYNCRANIFFSLDFFEKLKGQKSQSIVNSLWWGFRR